MTILLVDDEQSLLEIFSECLRRAGYEVRKAVDGEQARSIFLESPDSFGLLVSDIHMPRLTGVELARVVSRHGCPVLLISGGPIPPEAYGNGWDILTKPLLPALLTRTVAEILSRKPQYRTA
jgi:DNA-binding response OmpR family regulator